MIHSGQETETEILVEITDGIVMRAVDDSVEEFDASRNPTPVIDAGDAGAPWGVCERSEFEYSEQKARSCNCELDRRSETRSRVSDNQIGSRCVASICKYFAI
jgi:hypothetical protein